jgi:hypothetical protein
MAACADTTGVGTDTGIDIGAIDTIGVTGTGGVGFDTGIATGITDAAVCTEVLMG